MEGAKVTGENQDEDSFPTDSKSTKVEVIEEMKYKHDVSSNLKQVTESFKTEDKSSEPSNLQKNPENDSPPAEIL